MCPQQFGKLVLVGAPGIKPPRGDIYDVFLVIARDYLAANFHDDANCAEYQELYGADPTPEQVENWEVAREMASRLSWRPFMHSPSLPHLLRRLRGLPTLLAWGQQDAIVPLSAAEVYQASIPGAAVGGVRRNAAITPKSSRPTPLWSGLWLFWVMPDAERPDHRALLCR